MSVLGYAACQENRHGNHSGCVKGHEYHMRTGFRYYAYDCCQKNHQGCVVAYPMTDIEMLQSDSENKQYSESPCEDDRQMLSDDMVPKMLFHEMVRSEQQHEKHDHAQSGEQHVHPVLAQKVDVQ